MIEILRTKRLGILLLIGLITACSRAPLPTPTPGSLAIPQESVVIEPAETVVAESAELEPTTPTFTPAPTIVPTPEATATVEPVVDSAETGDAFAQENDRTNAEITASQPITYVVQAGDALELIALSFDVDLNLLAEANNIASFDQIEIGQLLVIPTGDGQPVQVESGEDNGEFIEYTVVAGDALSLLAERFDISAAALADANGLAVTDELLIGQQLIIPNQ